MILPRFTAAWIIATVLIPLAPPGTCAEATPKPHAPVDASPAPEANSGKENDNYYELLKLFVDTLDQVERNYVKDLSRRELIEAAIQGMLAKLDEHTNYIGPEDIDRFRTSIESEFPGIGVQPWLERGQLVVRAVLPDTPAERSGIAAGDVITHIQNQPTASMKLDDAVKQLRGEAGSRVVLQVLHPTTGKEETLTLTRELVRVETVRGDHRIDEQHWEYMTDAERGIAYVRIVLFGRHSAQELQKVLAQLESEHMQALVLDLRFNPGGLLTTAVDVSDLFIAAGRIVSTRGRNVKEQIWDAQRPGTMEGFPMVVLVNQYSASASEIVAASLQDQKRAVVVGQRTFGKGSVQNIVELDGGRSAVKLTTAFYLRPSGKNIDRDAAGGESAEWGVRPNDGLEVVLSAEEARRLIVARRERDNEIPGVPGSHPAPRFEDKQLDKALSYLREQLAAQPVAAAAKREQTPAQPEPR